MKKNELIEKLRELEEPNTWRDGMGMCGVSDFITIPQNIQTDEEIMNELYWAIEHRNGAKLQRAMDSGGVTRDEIWEAWTNGDIEFDYSDIQALIDQYDH